MLRGPVKLLCLTRSLVQWTTLRPGGRERRRPTLMVTCSHRIIASHAAVIPAELSADAAVGLADEPPRAVQRVLNEGATIMMGSTQISGAPAASTPSRRPSVITRLFACPRRTSSRTRDTVTVWPLLPCRGEHVAQARSDITLSDAQDTPETRRLVVIVALAIEINAPETSAAKAEETAASNPVDRDRSVALDAIHRGLDAAELRLRPGRLDTWSTERLVAFAEDLADDDLCVLRYLRIEDFDVE